MALNIISTFTGIASDERAIQSLKEATLNSLFYDQAENFFRITPGIKGGQQVVALDGLEYVTTKDAGCGNNTSRTFSVSGITQYWNPQRAAINIKMCYSDFEDAFLKWSLGNGYDARNLQESDFFDFIQVQISDAMKADFMRIALFGDADIASQSILADTDKEKYYDLIDKGLVPTLQYLKTFSDLTDQFDSIDANSLTTRTAQMELDSTVGLDIFESLTDEVYFDYDMILCSHSLYKNYKNYLRKGTGALESSKAELQQGLEDLLFDGSALKPIKFYDKKRKEDFTITTSGVTVTHLPHFAVLTKQDNLVIGVDDMTALADLRLEYVGGSDEHFYIKGSYLADFKIPNPKALRAAF